MTLGMCQWSGMTAVRAECVRMGKLWVKEDISQTFVGGNVGLIKNINRSLYQLTKICSRNSLPTFPSNYENYIYAIKVSSF